MKTVLEMFRDFGCNTSIPEIVLPGNSFFISAALVIISGSSGIWIP
jgi:hypothetical protein